MQGASSSGHDLVVVGAGLVGLAVSTFFARQGLSVLVIERYDDPRISETDTARSIGLTLCRRGIGALDALGLGPQLGQWLVPIIGRRVHFQQGGTELQPYALAGEGVLYSIRRTTLLKLLCRAAAEAGVAIQFRTACEALNTAERSLTVVGCDSARHSLHYEALICADGARSTLRAELGGTHGVTTTLAAFPQMFKEIGIAAQAARNLDPGALHVWPRGDHLLIALPNVDGSFSATVFAPDSSPDLCEAASQKQVRTFFERELADLVELVPDCDSQYVANPVGRMLTVQCDRWSYPGGVLIAGDAAHAMPPFYGQGLNCALEGCQLLAEMACERRGHWQELFTEFERRRRPDVAAIWQLSHANHRNLSRKVAEDDYRSRRTIEAQLQRRFPTHFMPLYAMIAFSTLSYAEASARAARQDALVERLMQPGEVADSAERLAGEEVADLLAPLPGQTQASAPGWLPPSPRAAAAQRIPLARSQERIWFFERFWPDDDSYSLTVGHELRGRLRVEALQESLRTVVDRHEALRTRIIEADGQPWQIVDPPGAFVVEQIAAAPAGPMTAERVGQILGSFAGQRLDLAAPLFRCLLWKFSDSEHLLVLRVHHIVVDRHSMSILVKEWSTLYSAHVRGQPVVLPPVHSQLADYVRWERATLSGTGLANALAFWRSRLEGTPALDLPLDRSRPATMRNELAALTHPLPGTAATALRALARACGVTPFVAALACYFVVLSRWSRQEDFGVGCVVANRAHPTSLGTVGCLFNTIVIRCAPQRDLPFRQFLRQVGKAAREGLVWQHVPIDAVVAGMHRAGDSARPPLYQAMFTLRYGGDALVLPDLAVQALGRRYVQAATELSLELIDRGAETTVICQYNSALFADHTVRSLTDGFCNILVSAAQDPTARIGELRMLGDAERLRVLHAWNATQLDLGAQCCLHQLVEVQAERSPDAVAVACDGESISYRELNARANRIAHLLVRHGVGPGERVAMCMQRSVAMVTGLLAVMKAGGAYVPLDPEYPQERLRYMWRDARPRLGLVDPQFAALLAEHGEVLNAAEWDRTALGLPEHNIPPDRCGLTPGHPAYVLYTSGSTGAPKAAVNAHSGIVNRLRWMQWRYSIGPADTVLHKTSICFDVSVWELFWPLTAGARLLLGAPRHKQDPAYLQELIDLEGVTIVHFVPAMLRSFLEASASGLPSVRHLICSGEALHPDLVKQALARLHCSIHNLYGPTEAAIDVTSFECKHPADSIPIGRPLANCTCYVLDEDYEPVPAGVPGELFIGGAQVGLGYLHRPDLTAERFVPDPFAGSGMRMYRTGDLARLRPEGNIEFLGRNDGQVKVRGFRVELGEIEAQLRQHPAVREAVVVAREEAPGERHLCAYLTWERSSAPARLEHSGASTVPDAQRQRELREYLTKHLPHYMVPALFVSLDALPLTASGKIDRRALPAPQQAASRNVMAAETPTERVLAEIWREVLKLEVVGVEDSFFDLGGYSLLATRLTARIQSRFGVTLSMSGIFEAPTVRELARVIDSRPGNDRDSIPPLVARRRR